jgi:hypothetical protein
MAETRFTNRVKTDCRFDCPETFRTSCSTTNALQLVFGNPWQSGVAHVHAEQPHLEKHTSNPSNPSKLSISFFLILLKLPLTHIP